MLLASLRPEEGGTSSFRNTARPRNLCQALLLGNFVMSGKWKAVRGCWAILWLYSAEDPLHFPATVSLSKKTVP